MNLVNLVRTVEPQLTSLATKIQNYLAPYVAIRDFKMPWRRRQRERQKSNRSKRQNNNAAHASRFLYISSPSLHDYDRKMLNFTFCGGRKQSTVTWNFLSLSELQLNMVLRDSAQKEFACIWQSKWVGVIAREIEKTKIHSVLSGVFVAAAVVVSFKNSLLSRHKEER